MSRHGAYADGNTKFQLVLSEELRDQMKDRALSEGTSASEIWRRAARKYLTVPVPARKKRGR